MGGLPPHSTRPLFHVVLLHSALPCAEETTYIYVASISPDVYLTLFFPFRLSFFFFFSTILSLRCRLIFGGYLTYIRKHSICITVELVGKGSI